jgi:hypothetical protein
MKVFPKEVLQQFLNRPTINDLQQCQQQLRIILEEKSCAPLFVRRHFPSNLFDFFTFHLSGETSLA